MAYKLLCTVTSLISNKLDLGYFLTLHISHMKYHYFHCHEWRYEKLNKQLLIFLHLLSEKTAFILAGM